MRPQPVRRDYHRRDSVAERFASLIGSRSAGAAHQRARKALRDLKAFLEACRLEGRPLRARAVLGQLEAIAEPVEWSDDLILEVVSADQLEDWHRQEHLLARCNATLRRWVGSAHKQQEHTARLIRAAESRLGITR